MICCLNPDCLNPLNPDGKKSCQSCGTTLVPLLRNRFRVVRVLSDEGGFGRTYLSEDKDKLNEPCVIKQLAPKFQGTWSQKKAVELFAEEAKRLQELGEHPQIPTLMAYFEQDNCLYLVQQFINGQNLLKELQQRKNYRPGEIQAILLDLLPVLKFIHDRGVIHRDIKPENIIRCRTDGRLNLIDFGSSKQLTAKVQNFGTSIGSHGYSPLEQIRDGKAYAASDLFALGATCFHLITSVSPFQLWMEHGYSWVSNWRQYLHSPLTPELDFVLDKLLQKDLKHRYTSADEVIKDITPKQPLALPAAGQTSGKIPVPQTTYLSKLPKKYSLLRSVVLLSALVLLFGFSESWFSQYLQIYSSLSARLTQNKSGQVVLAQPQKTTLRTISLANTLPDDENAFVSLAISPNGQIIASCGSDRTIKIWQLATGEDISSLKGHSRKVNAVVFSPDGKTLVSGGDDNTIKIWNLKTGKVIRTITGHSDAVHTLAISPNGKTLVSGSDDNTVKVWNLNTGRLINTLTGHTFWVRSVAISPDGVNIASGSFDKTVKIWNLETGTLTHTLAGNGETVTSIAFNPDGNTLASASRDRTIKIWKVGAGTRVRTLKGSTETITSIAFSPDGNTLASASRDQTIKLWNLETGKEIRTLEGHENTVTTVAFTPDGANLVSGSGDNTMRIWRIGN
ncbi:protein kinase domain-containing protein [Anabaena sp. FACHB-709]|uniref:Serine/threonine kinase with WD-40 repeat protein n=2 Tax=Nostocaceae TaxID=1162 RepID=A0A1Z4KR70_ANAVA|nr:MULTISPECIES: serine/threonine-protein kinase [Nostocaceae]BAY71403.1 serine/threonine kinase with WD-40 repeat protein [Trichormus variabilis NIES-23]MBD2172088.1 serine/threonine protein kinase [Anabaena cylindrica FACHB-318]MBD2263721.1 serine/threonine protein kinase [Anabaena sp. FACHB-709]MBD2274693.1 serine/threonine protein kinase [Nostoc sp. PCC 7120 = FACHB-418]MBD2284818.1 serine/threonine protein kinase [Anabaena cylindrica FACHB-170]